MNSADFKRLKPNSVEQSLSLILKGLAEHYKTLFFFLKAELIKKEIYHVGSKFMDVVMQARAYLRGAPGGSHKDQIRMVIFARIENSSLLCQNMSFLNDLSDTFGSSVRNRINQLLDYGTRWQHGSQICFATFIN
jgi:hypothetical protein